MHCADRHPVPGCPAFKLDELADCGTGITWSSTSGQKYQLQSETNATAASWTNVNGVITATGTNTTTTNAVTTAIQFYRVHAVP